MRAYKILLGECTTARELAVVVGKMLADENCRNVDKHTVVKAAFIKSLLPFCQTTRVGRYDSQYTGAD